MINPHQLLTVLCSVQRALLGAVTPNLRAVYITSEQENSFDLIFYYDKELSEDEEELCSFADTEFIADFPSPTYKTDCTVKIIPYPDKIPRIGRCVYRRYEK